jgi:hypothetical protein
MTMHAAHEITRADAIAATSRPLPRRLFLAMGVLFGLGALIFVIGLFVDADRAWNAFHTNWLFFAGLSSAGCTFVAVQRITTARWSREVIRLMEGYVAFLPIAFVFLLLIVFAGKNHIFPWTREAYPVAEKALYFNPAFFSIRVVVVFAIITALSLWYIYTCVRLDVGTSPEWQPSSLGWWARMRARMRDGFRDERREIHATHSLQGKLAVFVVFAFAFGWTVLAWDLSMGLSLHFQSTLYSWWFFMGAWLCSLTLFGLLTMAWRRYLGAYELIREVHFHDIGKLMFAFTAFWGYLTFGQYLVIWYGNLGEETFFMRLRLIAGWKPVTVTAIVLVFALPFFGLLSRTAKVYLPTLAFFALSSLTGMWLMRYTEVYPSRYGVVPSAPFGIWEIGTALLYIGAWGWAYATFMDAVPRVRATLLTSPYRDEVQIPVDPETMEPLPAHE